LRVYAERYFQLNAAEGDETKRQSLERQIERAEIEGKVARVAEIEAELEMPEFPEPLAYLWRTYLRLRRRMAGGFAGHNPIGWQDIDAFSRRAGLRLSPWEIETLERIDDLFVYRDETPAASAATRPMTEQLFDTLFA
jgi:hypothetical protein